LKMFLVQGIVSSTTKAAISQPAIDPRPGQGRPPGAERGARDRDARIAIQAGDRDVPRLSGGRKSSDFTAQGGGDQGSRRLTARATTQMLGQVAAGRARPGGGGGFAARRGWRTTTGSATGSTSGGGCRPRRPGARSGSSQARVAADALAQRGLTGPPAELLGGSLVRDPLHPPKSPLRPGVWTISVVVDQVGDDVGELADRDGLVAGQVEDAVARPRAGLRRPRPRPRSST